MSTPVNPVILLLIKDYNNSNMKQKPVNFFKHCQHLYNPQTKSQKQFVHIPYRQELTYSNGIIFKGTRMLVPKTLRNAMKHLPHTCHLGIVKTINRVKEIIYQPGINNDITNIEYVKNTETNKNKNPLYLTTCQTLHGQEQQWIFFTQKENCTQPWSAIPPSSLI